MANERFYQGPYFDNLGMSYSSPTFTIHGALGRDLSAANPAYIVLPSNGTPGEFVKYKVTSNYTFDDASGTSDITGNLFGLTTGIAWAQDMPFFIYAVANDADTAVTFMISRLCHKKFSAGTIGKPSSAVADNQDDFWALDDGITVGDYDVNPCYCIGVFTMQMDTSDDWTVQTLTDTDGFGKYAQDIRFLVPFNQFGASSGTYLLANGGTAPIFSTANIRYQVLLDGTCHMEWYMNGDGGTDGSGAVSALMCIPFIAETSQNAPIGNGYMDYAGNAGTANYCSWNSGGTSPPNVFLRNETGGIVQNAAFSNGGRQLSGSCTYKIKDQGI